jgi:hypothetical protein
MLYKTKLISSTRFCAKWYLYMKIYLENFLKLMRIKKNVLAVMQLQAIEGLLSN